MKKRKNIITVAIDSPAAAGAGSQAKLIAKHYNLLYLDTGRIYRHIGKMKLELDDKKFNYSLIKKEVRRIVYFKTPIVIKKSYYYYNRPIN